jgi:hypothetical protein
MNKETQPQAQSNAIASRSSWPLPPSMHPCKMLRETKTGITGLPGISRQHGIPMQAADQAGWQGIA